MKYKHFILTRFNFGLYSDNPYKVPNPDEWMAHRCQLFEKYCLPSVQDQQCKEFTWLISFDPHTPYHFIERYNYLEQVKIIYDQPHLWLRTQHPFADWLITSRFDNDDMYDQEFTVEIQRNFREREEVIDIDYDVLELKTGVRYASERPRANSPFLSLVERWERLPMTALGRPHTLMPDIYPARKLGVLATQIIHDRNQSNKIP